MRRHLSLFLASLLLSNTMVGSAAAQVPTGGIRGAVTDPSKAAIAGAKITVKSRSTGIERAVETNSDGEYQVANLQPGEYEIKVASSGFKTGVAIVTVEVGANLTNDFMLEVGQITDTIEVTGATTIINTTDHKVDGVVNRLQIENLPLNGRNFLQLALLEPGVSVASVDNPGSSPNNFFRVSVAGASQAMTRISVDGATINDRVTGGTAQNFSQETVQEFQISTFNFDLSTSVTSVGSVNVVSKSGSNEVHGSAFIYYRDNNLAAFPGLQRDPLAARDPSRADPFFARRQWGGSLGGPISKDKVFFFANYEKNNQDGVVALNSNHPIWSKFNAVVPQPMDFDQANLRVDYKINDRNSAFIRLSVDNNDNFNADGISNPSHWVKTRNVAHQVLGVLNTIFNQTLVNDLRYSYGFYSGRLKIPTAEDCRDPVACVGLGGPQVRSTLGGLQIGNNINVPQNRVLRTYQLTETLSWQKGTHRVRVGGEWEHLYGIGSWAFLEPALFVAWDPAHVAAFAAAVPPVFGPLYNSLPASLKVNPANPSQPLTATPPTISEIFQLPLFLFLTGIGDPGQPQSFRQPQASRNDRYRWFASDSWRVKPHFTLNYGVAWVYEDNVLNHDLDRPAYLAPLLGDLRPPKRDKNNFDPSLGFAWDVGGSGKTVIRGGAGVYHDSNLFWTRLNERAYVGPSGNGRSIIPGSIFGLEFRAAPTNTRVANVMANLAALRAGLAARLGNGRDLSVRGVETFKTTGEPGFGGIFDRNTVIGYAVNTSLGIQREIARDLVVQADFVMRRSLKFGGLHNTFIIDRNRFNRAPQLGGPVIPPCTSAAQAGDPRAKCSTGSIAVSHPGANYRYTGLHVKVDKRFSDRYLFVASYALSKFTGFNGVGNGVYNLDNFYEADDYQAADRRHRFTFSGFVELPTYKGDSKFLRGLFNSWQIGLISQFVSKPGLETLISTVDLDGDGVDTLILPGSTFRGFGRGVDRNELLRLVNQFNATFAGKRTIRNQLIPAITLPPNFDHGDTFQSQDLRLTRNIQLSEKCKLQLIGEAFNLFNISNLVDYNGTLNAPNYGVPRFRAGGVFGTGGPRAFQLAARLPS